MRDAVCSVNKLRGFCGDEAFYLHAINGCHRRDAAMQNAIFPGKHNNQAAIEIKIGFFRWLYTTQMHAYENNEYRTIRIVLLHRTIPATSSPSHTNAFLSFLASVFTNAIRFTVKLLTSPFGSVLSFSPIFFSFVYPFFVN